MGKFADALGIWELKIGKVDFELKPKMGDNRRFRRIMMNDKFKKDNAGRMEQFEDFFVELVKRDYPEEDEIETKLFVEFNSQVLFEETMVKFRWSTRKELDQSKEDSIKDLKKSMLDA